MPDPDYASFSSHDGVSIAYRVSGEGKPVVLVHGYTVTSMINFAMHLDLSEDGRITPVPGPTIESALLDAGYQVVMFDLRGHGLSAKPHDPSSYSMEAHAGDVQAIVEHLSLRRPAVVGYSLGGMITGWLLTAGVSAAALCGVVSYEVDGADQEFLDQLAIVGKCFLEDRWSEYPGTEVYRDLARLDPQVDFAALGAVALGMRGMPPDILKAANIPVLVLNGGGDDGAEDELDLTPLIPGAQRAVAGTGDHVAAPNDPLFQQELVRFLRAAY